MSYSETNLRESGMLITLEISVSRDESKKRIPKGDRSYKTGILQIMMIPRRKISITTWWHKNHYVWCTEPISALCTLHSVPAPWVIWSPVWNTHTLETRSRGREDSALWCTSLSLQVLWYVYMHGALDHHSYLKQQVATKLSTKFFYYFMRLHNLVPGRKKNRIPDINK